MPLIPEGMIDEVQTRADIVELIGRYVPLKRAGRHYKANCPFHKEKTPSFMVNTDKQIFHCFGCGVGGNIFTFLMQHDRLTFPEAVRQLADHVGIHVPERKAGSDDGAHERLAALMEKVCRYFERMLHEPKAGKAARAYLAQRGVSDRTRQAFRLGLAPDGWDHLLRAAKSTGVAPEPLEASGLVIRGTSGYYDRFRSRLMFPILDVRGRIVGFGGRSLDGREPKYLNSPETALYTKGRHLFGLAQAKDAMVKANTAVLVEGYFDCVVLSDGGIAHAVSPLGTALTIDQARLLKRYAETVILAFDPDAAGEQATLRGIDLLVEAGLHVRVAQLPRGVDPDECLRTSGRERFERFLNEAAGIFDVLVQSALQRHPTSDAEGKVRAAQCVLPTIARVPDAMLRREYVRLLAERLRLDEAAVATELAKAQPRAAVVAAPAAPSQPARTLARGPERLLTALVLDDPTRWARARGEERLSLAEVTDPTLRRILSLVEELEATGQGASPAQVVSRLSEEGLGGLVAELVGLGQSSIEAADTAFDDCVRRLQANARKQQLERLLEDLKIAQNQHDEDTVHQLLTEINQQQRVMSEKGGGSSWRR